MGEVVHLPTSWSLAQHVESCVGVQILFSDNFSIVSLCDNVVTVICRASFIGWACFSKVSRAAVSWFVAGNTTWYRSVPGLKQSKRGMCLVCSVFYRFIEFDCTYCSSLCSSWKKCVWVLYIFSCALTFNVFFGVCLYFSLFPVARLFCLSASSSVAYDNSVFGMRR